MIYRIELETRQPVSDLDELAKRVGRVVRGLGSEALSVNVGCPDSAPESLLSDEKGGKATTGPADETKRVAPWDEHPDSPVIKVELVRYWKSTHEGGWYHCAPDAQWPAPRPASRVRNFTLMSTYDPPASGASR